MKAKPGKKKYQWTDTLILAGLVTVSMLTGWFWNSEYRFAMIGIFCALIFGISEQKKPIILPFLLAGLSLLLSFSREPFFAATFLLIADAIVVCWYLSRVSWSRARDSQDLAILVTAFLSVFLFLIVDLHSVDPRSAVFLTYLFFLLKPLSWTQPKQLSQEEGGVFEFALGVLPILAFSCVYPPTPSIEFSLVAALVGLVLALVGSGSAAPSLMFLSLVHLFPAWLPFAGLVGFCSLYTGWPQKLLLTLLALGFSLQFEFSQESIYWAVSTCGALTTAYLFARKMPKLTDFNQEWRGIAMAVVLFSLPIYLKPELTEINFEKFDGSTLGILLLYFAVIILFVFWKPKFLSGFRPSLPIWKRFVSFTGSEMTEGLVVKTQSHKVAGIERASIMELNSFQMLLWLLFLTVAIIAVGGFS